MLIDEKGRVFGKINVIDLAVIIFVVLCVAGMVPGCLKITGADRKALEMKIKGEQTEAFRKSLSDEFHQKSDGYLQILKRHAAMDQAQEQISVVWKEGFKAGYAEGYSDGRR
jgi:hypothetical protein